MRWPWQKKPAGRAKIIFVFGSNLHGRHGGGAARDAVNFWGAKNGYPVGRQGDAYAIPTMDHDMHPMEIEDIREFVNMFIEYAQENPHLTFLVTKIGCGIAGLSEDDIRPLFRRAPLNCHLPEGWAPE